MTETPLDTAHLVTFAHEHPLGVVATTAPDGAPEAALVDLVALDDGTLLFTAHLHARKLANLALTPHAAVVIGTSGTVSVQVEGSARTVEGEERQRLGEAFLSLQPGSRALHEDFALVAITPLWARRYDVSTRPPTVVEARW